MLATNQTEQTNNYDKKGLKRQVRERDEDKECFWQKNPTTTMTM
jgi:hypothetical protein